MPWLFMCVLESLTQIFISVRQTLLPIEPFLFLLSMFTRKFNLRFDLQGDLINCLHIAPMHISKIPSAMSIFQSIVLILSELFLLKKNNKQNKTK